MWEKIKSEIKKKLPTDLWIETINQVSFKDNKFYLTVPNDIYIEKIESTYKSLINDAAKLINNASIDIVYIINNDIKAYNQLFIKAINSSNNDNDITIQQHLNPNIKNKLQLENYLKKPTGTNRDSLKSGSIIKMTPRFSSNLVASLTSIDSKYFTYSNDKRKSAIVNVKYNFTDEESHIYKLYRGIEAFGVSPVGQLTTNHARILFALIHTWQKNGCEFYESKDQAVVIFSLRQLLDDLGYIDIGGTIYRLIYSRIKDLVHFPYVLSHDGIKGYGFTFLSSINTISNKDKYNKLIVRSTFNPFISRQLYDRKTFYRKPECYLIRNAIALKFLLAYDKAIFKGNIIEITIQDLADNLEINYNRKDVLIKALKRALVALNGYELDKQYNLTAYLSKKDNEYYIIAKRNLKNNKNISV
ncbi:hypothetical protein AGMMS49531_01530 [Endomicrobiia bacterium]|nr:hypothetical protein AGMMS49531_01530 [Endomicrobiia bacterium]